MKRDYLSREGSLVLKGNGVYSLRGTEDKGRILWQFVYLVDDRRNAAGEKMSGEKVCKPTYISGVRAGGDANPYFRWSRH